MLNAQHEIESRSSLRAVSTSSSAELVALELDPKATSTEDQIRAVERATDGEIRRATREAAKNPRFVSLIGDDFNIQSTTSSSAIGVVEHDTKGDDGLFESIQ